MDNILTNPGRVIYRDVIFAIFFATFENQSICRKNLLASQLHIILRK